MQTTFSYRLFLVPLLSYVAPVTESGFAHHTGEVLRREVYKTVLLVYWCVDVRVTYKRRHWTIYSGR